ncbi:sulfite oxidase [Xanthocytophaga agilis]|uniref:Sulfite oxidase n=1 Tax=Xanthocytophaga agilis TaxID=3048010 RepID=A0AAE3R5G5_9BACT|nr:sulfite oxidase [Xanthocytophaga agilis]MDJ1504006.1 sulfite oxidase [Xanthocytophaga agilis]
MAGPFDNKPLWDRRGFLRKSLVGAFSATLGTQIVFAENMPRWHTPLALQADNPLSLPAGKHKDLIILNDRPWNVETPPHLLDDEITPVDKMFIRNNGNTPESIDLKNWTLTIDGESVKKQTIFKLSELKKKFKPYTYRLVLECGGNGRSGYYPITSGNQWHEGGVSCAEWTGVRLRDVLESVGIKDDAIYIGYYGKDVHLSGDSSKPVISRGVPIRKALEEETLLAWALNGQDIPLIHGYPLRLVIGGWPASVSGKWLSRISIRNKEHDGPKMEGHSYRVPAHPIEPGSKVPDSELKIIESMPVKSVITYPKSGAIVPEGKPLELRGHAWAGDLEVAAMQVSIDYGATWITCNLRKPHNRLAWQQWSVTIPFPKKGYYEVWAKATDSKGVAQPMVIPAWNPGGYLNNACHRIAVKVE